MIDDFLERARVRPGDLGGRRCGTRSADDVMAHSLVNLGSPSNISPMRPPVGPAGGAARLLGAAEAVRRETGALLSPGTREAYDATVGHLEGALGAKAFRRAWSEGATESMEALLAKVLAAPPPAPGRDPAAPGGPGGALTRLGRQVTRVLAAGRSNKEIAAELVIAVGTAGIHVEHILRKLDLRSRHQVADWARERGLTR